MEGLLSATGYLVSGTPLLWMMLGTALGIVAGAIPGITGAMLISLTLPLTFGMLPNDALILLVSMYVGSISGGLISATLLRMPGTPASLMTTLDGYPLARAGQPGRALGLGITASFVGGLVSWLFLVLLSEPMAKLSTKLGYFDTFALVLMALVLIASVSGKSLLRGILSGFLGIFVAMIGTNPSTGQLRLTLGFDELADGIKLLPVLIGLFAVAQMIRDVLDLDSEPETIEVGYRGIFMKLVDWKNQAVNLLRSSVIGTWIGMLPGVGANVGSILAYTTAKNMSKTPEEFGHGSEEGIVASESANNATVGGALIPLIALGIPGSVIDAILLGALVMHGLQPGPQLFSHNPDIVHQIMATALFANVFMFVVMLSSVGLLAGLTRVPRAYLVPILFVFCVVGSYALGNRMFDVWVMLLFGGVGLLFDRVRIPTAPFVIGLVLAPVAELNLSAGLMKSGGSLLPLVTSPLSLVFVLCALGLLTWSLARRTPELETRSVSEDSSKTRSGSEDSSA